MTATYAGIELTVDHDVAVIRLSRPHALNAPDREMHHALAAIWFDIAGWDNVRAVVLTGAGRAFCAGTDRDLLRCILDDEVVRREVISEASRIVLGLAHLPMPIVAAVNGPAAGLACSLVALCDIVVMSEEAYLTDPHVPLGLAGGDGIAIAWPHLTGLLAAKEHALFGSRVDAQEAFRLGLTSRVVPLAELEAEAHSIARRLASLSVQAVRATKDVLHGPIRQHLETALGLALAVETRSLQLDENRMALQGVLSGSGRGDR